MISMMLYIWNSKDRFLHSVMFSFGRVSMNKQKMCQVCDSQMSIFLLKCPECGSVQEKIQRKIEKKSSAKCKGEKKTYKTHKQATAIAKKLYAEKGRMSEIYR